MKELRPLKVPKSHLLPFLNVVKFALFLLLVVMFMSFNAKIAHQQQDIKSITQSTHNVVKGQDDILKAIQQVTTDTRVTAQEQTAIIICMLQVPIDQRTTDLQKQCRDEVKTTDVNGNSSTGTTGTGSSGASSNGSTSSTPAQSSNSQSATNPTPTPASEAPQNPGFFQRNIIDPIRSIINGL